jgi:hypothetical protein
MIRELGPEVTVSVEGRSWRVPRHFLALHGLKACLMETLAKKYGFAEVTK